MTLFGPGPTASTVFVLGDICVRPASLTKLVTKP